MFKLGMKQLSLVVTIVAFLVLAPYYIYHGHGFDPATDTIISRETTYLEGPITPEGRIDYVAALDAESRKGVTPENNAVVPLAVAYGPEFFPEEIRDESFVGIGVEPVPEGSETDYIEFRRFQRAEEDAQGARPASNSYDEFDAARSRPWTAKEFPQVARWLERNKAVTEGARAASKRSRFYYPKISITVVGMPNPSEECGRIGELLRIHAWLNTGERRFDAVFDDLFTLHRLARVYAMECTVFDLLAAIKNENGAMAIEQRLATARLLTRDQAEHLLSRLDRLPPIPASVERLNRHERLEFLDYLTLCAFLGPKQPWSKPRELMPRSFDLNVALRLSNALFDDELTAYREPTCVARELACDKLFERNRTGAQLFTRTRLLQNALRTPDGRSARNGEIAFVAAAAQLFVPGPALRFFDRNRMETDLTRIALSLAIYRDKHGQYPESLDQLKPAILPVVPLDRFTEKPLVYRRTKDDYVLYSLGPNGIDNGGEHNGAAKDDITVSLPKIGMKPSEGGEVNLENSP